jgi:hypothetical protein
VEGRPWLLPAEAAFADAGKLRTLGRWAGEAEAALRDILPSAAAREALPVVAVVAPGRRDFEAMVAPAVDPVPVEGSTIAYALRRERVLLFSPEALEPGGPPCEAMDVLHESAHAWLHARTRGHAPLPLWLEEGIAGIVAERGADSREWCRKLLALRKEGLDPFSPARVLDLRVYGDAARDVAPLAPCEERPYSLLVLFHAHAEALALFLTDAPGEPERREAFGRWLASALDGKDAPATEAAKALGFDSPAALFEARDRWLGK